jgi:hypothetical protein
MFGKPGEPRYEAMIDSLQREFAKGKLTPRQKEKARKAKRERQRAAMKNS